MEVVNDNSCSWIHDLDKRNNIQTLSSNLYSEWLIIGAGYTGLSAARKLGQLYPNKKIILVDAQLAGEGASSRNSGFLVDSTLNDGFTSNKELESYKKKADIYDLGIKVVKRFINEQPRNRHIGLDIAAAEGRPIFAPLNGKVILAGNFFYKGNVIFIDHGNGLVSSYSHLSKKLVDLNQIVTTGDNIGLVGSTGRVTGPHLHWEVYFLGIPINPEIFIKN